MEYQNTPTAWKEVTFMVVWFSVAQRQPSIGRHYRLWRPYCERNLRHIEMGAWRLTKVNLSCALSSCVSFESNQSVLSYLNILLQLMLMNVFTECNPLTCFWVIQAIYAWLCFRSNILYINILKTVTFILITFYCGKNGHLNIVRAFAMNLCPSSWAILWWNTFTIKEFLVVII